MAFRAAIRQLMFPKEFRIDNPNWPADVVLSLKELSQEVRQLRQESKPGSTSGQTPADSRIDFLANVATGLWRLRQKMLDTETNQPLEGMRRAYRHLESTWDALTQEGLVVTDHTGGLFDSGMAIKVLAFQPTPGLDREQVLETIKPSVHFRNRRLQMGEVIVGRPDDDTSDNNQKHQS